MGKAEEEAKKIAASIQQAKDTMDELLFATRDFASEAAKAAKELGFNAIQAAETRKAFRDLAKVQEEIALSIEDVNDGMKSMSDVSKTQAKLDQKKKKLQLELNQSLSANVKKHVDMEKILKGEFDVTNDIMKKGVPISAKARDLLEIYQEQFKTLQETEGEMDQIAARAAQIEGGLGGTGKALKGLSKLFPKLGIDKAVQEGRELSAELTKGTDGAAGLGVKMQTAAKMLDSVGGGMLKAVGPAAILAKLFGAIKEVDKASGEFAKNMGISYKEALALRGEMSDVAESTKDVMVDSKSLMETQVRLNEYFGQTVKFSGDLAADMDSISKRTKMSADTQGILAMESLKTGKKAKDVLKTINLQVMEMNKQKGLNMSFKQVQDAIGKTSKALQLTFKGSTKELVKQVMSAKKLGASMEQVNSIASSLLDFEGSIQAELEAELLLGKDINLEKARQFALEGDMGKMAKEVLKNKAIMNAFETKNVIAQEAAAKALGLSRDQLAEMVMEQQKQKTLQDAFGDQVTDMNSAQAEYNRLRATGMSAEQVAAQMGDEALSTQMESVSQAEQLEAAMTRIQETFVQIAEPVLGIVQGIMDMVGGAQNLAAILKGMLITYVAIKTTNMVLGAMGKTQIGIQSTLAAITGTKATAEIAAASALTLGIGVVAIIAGIAAAVMAMKSQSSSVKSSMKDGVIGPGGEMIVSGPKGSIQLDKEDSLIAGTDLGRKRGGGARRDAALIAKVEQLIAVNQKILAKSPVIEMQGNEVGQGINTDSRAVQ